MLLEPYLREDYDTGSLGRLRRHLSTAGTFELAPLTNGLFPAAAGPRPERTGYSAVWIRDNVHVAHAEAATGQVAAAARNARSLARFLAGQRRRFEAIIDGRADARRLTERPHIRFDGRRLEEFDVAWPHAQNDALGYFLWLYARLGESGHVEIDADLVRLIVRYLGVLPFWLDEENGHWEETPKIEASSIGTVLAGLEATRAWARADGAAAAAELVPLLDDMLAEGRRELERILPAECIQPAPSQYRAYDAALLFLVEPLGVVGGPMARRIVDDVTRNLLGEHGVKRYLGDSYWAPDYDRRYSPASHGGDWDGDTANRDRLLGGGGGGGSSGGEAQWCLFDPILCSIFARLFLHSGETGELERATWHLNRSLRQLTGDDGEHEPLRCCELYYLYRGRYRPNPNVPLLWTQANLKLAFHSMAEALAAAERS